jgi:hypothetical protein
MLHEKPLWQRMYQDECCTEVVRIIGYEGCFFRELPEKLKPLVEKFGEARVEAVSYHLLTYDGQMTRSSPPLARVMLRGEARKLAWGLLGPPPEHPWHDAYRNGGRISLPWEREETKPRDEEVEPEEEPEEQKTAEPGITKEGYAALAKGKNRRALLCMLRDARKKLAQHGRRSFSGKEAMKEIAAAEAELKNRRLTVPPEGEETAQWDKKKAK